MITAIGAIAAIVAGYVALKSYIEKKARPEWEIKEIDFSNRGATNPRLTIKVENTGWGKARNVKMEGRSIGEDGRISTISSSESRSEELLPGQKSSLRISPDPQEVHRIQIFIECDGYDKVEKNKMAEDVDIPEWYQEKM